MTWFTAASKEALPPVEETVTAVFEWDDGTVSVVKGMTESVNGRLCFRAYEADTLLFDHNSAPVLSPHEKCRLVSWKDH